MYHLLGQFLTAHPPIATSRDKEMYREQALENFYLIKKAEAERVSPEKSTLRGLRATPSIHHAIFGYRPADVRIAKQQRKSLS